MRSPIYTSYPLPENYSEIIDVRSPNEFAKDRIPDAINLPVLNNEERAKVGTIYKQVSPFEARKLGAGLVAQNISRHIIAHFASKDKNYSPLIYCWRGGQRSNSLAIVLSQVGWRVTVLEGGYQTYRAYIRQQLETMPLQFNYRILCGFTGSGKTELLHRLAARGEQVLDLEKLANHRGSLLGQEWQQNPIPQPSQKQFESLLLKQLQQCDRDRPIWIESESNKIGEIYLPGALWDRMKRSRCIEIQVPTKQRIEFLLKNYSYLLDNLEELKNKLAMLKYRYNREKIEQWYRLINDNKLEQLVENLLKTHYDPAYQRSLKRTYQQIETVIPLSDLSENNMENAVDLLSLAMKD